MAKKLRWLGVFALVFVLAFGFAGQALAAGDVGNSGKERMLVMFDSKVLNEPAVQRALIERFDGNALKELPIINGWVVLLPPRAAVPMMGAPGVLWVEPDGTIEAVTQTLPWGVDRIDADLVHPINKGTGAKVAVIDSGIDYNHEDLNDNDRGGYDFVNGDSDPLDDYGHGTHVAGIIAAEDNDVGVIGVAPEANLYALKVLDSSGSGSYSDLIDALGWCVDHGIQVANMSLGGTIPSRSLRVACDNAYNAGVLLVAAAGNYSSSRILYPAKYDSVLAVSATDQSDNLASFSNYGDQIELAGPGVSINSTLLGGGYGEKSGTSMSTPHVSGTAALVVAYGITGSSAIRDQLNTTAEDLGDPGRDAYFGYGLVDAEAAAPPPAATGSIAGTVTNADTGDLIANATVTADAYSTTTADDGTYTLADLPVGTYTVTASATGYIDASQTVDVLENQITTADFGLSPQPTGIISGTVTDADTEEAIANATVTADGYSTTTAADGTYTLADLPVGTYTVTASATGYADASQTIDVVENLTTTADFALTPVAGNENDMYVWDIDFSKKSAGPNTFLYVTVTISSDSNANGLAEEADAEVAAATVGLRLDNQTAGQSWTGEGDTDSNGQVTFKLNKAPSGTYVAEVTSLTHNTYTWNSALDAENPSDPYTL